MAGGGDIPPAALQNAGDGVVGREMLQAGKDTEMTDDEFIKMAADALEECMNVELTDGEIDRLIALARIGAAVQPRPISEACIDDGSLSALPQVKP